MKDKDVFTREDDNDDDIYETIKNLINIPISLKSSMLISQIYL